MTTGKPGNPPKNAAAESGAFDPTPIEAAEFHTSLSIEYDVLLVVGEDGTYHVPGVRCDDCGAIDRGVYAPTPASLTWAMSAAGSALAVVDDEVLADDDPRTGLFVCLDCGEGLGWDLHGRTVRVLTVDAYRHYAEFRIESGDPL